MPAKETNNLRTKTEEHAHGLSKNDDCAGLIFVHDWTATVPTEWSRIVTARRKTRSVRVYTRCLHQLRDFANLPPYACVIFVHRQHSRTHVPFMFGIRGADARSEMCIFCLYVCDKAKPAGVWLYCGMCALLTQHVRVKLVYPCIGRNMMDEDIE